MILGVDIGGTSVKLGLVDRDGRVHARTEVSVCFDGYETPILTTVIRAAKALEFPLPGRLTTSMALLSAQTERLRTMRAHSSRRIRNRRCMCPCGC